MVFNGEPFFRPGPLRSAAMAHATKRTPPAAADGGTHATVTVANRDRNLAGGDALLVAACASRRQTRRCNHQGQCVQGRRPAQPRQLRAGPRGHAAQDRADRQARWPPPFRAATEKYSPQVQLGADGTLKGYVAGQPFPLVDPNDPQVATKVMWNFSYRPLYSDDIDMRYPEVATFDKTATGSPLSYYTVGHFAFYNNIGRIEVPPIPTDPDGAASGIRYRFGFYPFMEPSSLRGYGMVRQRHIDPTVEDNVWVFSPATRHVRRESPMVLSDAIGALPGFGGGGGAGRATGAAVAAREEPPEPGLSLTRSIQTHTSVSRGKSKISTTGSWARSRCSRRCTPCIHPSRNARSTAAKPFARKNGRCAICT